MVHRIGACSVGLKKSLQVWGKKRVRIYRPEHRSSLYPFPRGPLRNTSQTDGHDLDLSRFPAFVELPFYECVLRPGEMLYMPQRFWHEVTALEGSLSLSFWWT